MQPTFENLTIQPFLKWAGGKRWLINHIDEIIPPFEGRYIEPFLGSGAVFFHLSPSSAILSDTNKDLILTYQAIRSDWKRVKKVLEKHHRNHSKEYYYFVRSSRPRLPHTKAAQFIYLNRTCWNGLYRVNLSGTFNVPIGTKKNVILETDCFDKIAERLENAVLSASDFEHSINQAGENDFIFVDPPYTVKHNYNGFIKYNENLFSWEDQLRLKSSIDRAVGRGAKVLVTNANHPSLKDLYQGYRQIGMSRKNVLAAQPQHRGKFEELLVFCGYS